MRVAKVRNPMGRRTRVVGSSFITLRKTSAKPARMPPRAKGRVNPHQRRPRGQTETARRFFQARIDLSESAFGRADAEGQVADGVSHYEQRQGLVDAQHVLRGEHNQRQRNDDAGQDITGIRQINQPAIETRGAARRQQRQR